MALKTEGVTVDLNRITRAEFRDFLKRLGDITPNTPESDELSGELVARVVVEWPFDAPISKEGYIGLGLLDGKQVDDAVTEAMGALAQKK